MTCLTLATLSSVRQAQDSQMRTPLILRWLSDESGQDVIEYALLCTFLAFGAIAGVNLLGMAMKSSYLIWDSVGQSDRLIEVPDPKGP